MEYNKSGSRPVKRRLRKDRVFACLAVLIVIIFAVSSLISGCSKKDKKDKDKTKEADVQVTQTTPVPEQNDDYIICVDPGHGGDDPGSNYGDRTEVVDNLKYATVVCEELNKREGIKAIITRTSNDTHLDNRQRADISNKADADLHLALHRNFSEDPTANGVEVWVQKESQIVDEVLGYKLLEALKKVGIQSDRGVQAGFTNDKQNNFQIIEYTNMTACIVELGFISNDEDNRLFDTNYKDYAVAIANVVEEMCIDGHFDKPAEN